MAGTDALGAAWVRRHAVRPNSARSSAVRARRRPTASARGGGPRAGLPERVHVRWTTWPAPARATTCATRGATAGAVASDGDCQRRGGRRFHRGRSHERPRRGEGQAGGERQPQRKPRLPATPSEFSPQLVLDQTGAAGALLCAASSATAPAPRLRPSPVSRLSSWRPHAPTTARPCIRFWRTARSFWRARCNLTFTAPVSAPTISAIAATPSSSYSARIRTSRCSGASPRIASRTRRARSSRQQALLRAQLPRGLRIRRARQRPLAPGAARVAQAQVPRGGAQVGPEPGETRVVARRPLEQPHEAAVRDVARRLGRPRHAIGEAEYAIAVPRVDLDEGALVPRGGRPQQLLVRPRDGRAAHESLLHRGVERLHTSPGTQLRTAD